MIDQERLAEELQDLYTAIKEPIQKGNPQGLMDDLLARQSWLARAAELAADAQYWLDVARGGAAESVEPNMPWSVAKELIGGRTAIEGRLLKLADRLNATLTHQIDSIRSVLSYEKEQMRNG